MAYHLKYGRLGGKPINYLMEVCNGGLNGDVPKEWVDCKLRFGSCSKSHGYLLVGLLTVKYME